MRLVFEESLLPAWCPKCIHALGGLRVRDKGTVPGRIGMGLVLGREVKPSKPPDSLTLLRAPHGSP